MEKVKGRSGPVKAPSPPARAPDPGAHGLDDIVTISARAHADELRVDEADPSTRQGSTTIRRQGIPPGGAEHGVPYRDVDVSVEVQGRPRQAPPKEPSEREPGSG